MTMQIMTILNAAILNVVDFFTNFDELTGKLVKLHTQGRRTCRKSSVSREYKNYFIYRILCHFNILISTLTSYKCVTIVMDTSIVFNFKKFITCTAQDIKTIGMVL